MNKVFTRLGLGVVLPAAVAVAFLGCPGTDPFYLEAQGGQGPDGGSPSGGGEGGFSPMGSSTSSGCTMCGANCASLGSDPNNCGACGFKCSTDGVTTRTCMGGLCAPICATGFSDVKHPSDTDDGCETPWRVVFATADNAVMPTFGMPQTADHLCAAAAMGAFPTRTFMAWVSDASSSPATRFKTSDGPYVLSDMKTMVATSWQALTTQALLHPIDMDENGEVVGDAIAWTGTKPNGKYVGSPSCGGWSESTTQFMAVVGHANATDDTWTQSPDACIIPNNTRLYCFEQAP